MNKIQPIIKVNKNNFDYRDKAEIENGIGYFESELGYCCGDSALICKDCLERVHILNCLKSSLKEKIKTDKYIYSKVNEKKLRHIDLYKSKINNVRNEEYKNKIKIIEKSLIN